MARLATFSFPSAVMPCVDVAAETNLGRGEFYTREARRSDFPRVDDFPNRWLGT